MVDGRFGYSTDFVGLGYAFFTENFKENICDYLVYHGPKPTLERIDEEPT